MGAEVANPKGSHPDAELIRNGPEPCKPARFEVCERIAQLATAGLADHLAVGAGWVRVACCRLRPRDP